MDYAEDDTAFLDDVDSFAAASVDRFITSASLAGSIVLVSNLGDCMDNSIVPIFEYDLESNFVERRLVELLATPPSSWRMRRKIHSPH
jgi:hypothetical protein